MTISYSLVQYEMSRKLEEEPFMMGEMKTILKFEDLTSSGKLENVLSGTRTVAFSVLAQATLSAQAPHLVSDQAAAMRT